MKLKEFFTYLKPDEVISIVDEFGVIVKPVEYQKMPYVEVSESLDADAEVVQVYYDSGDSSLTIEITFDEEEDEHF